MCSYFPLSSYLAASLQQQSGEAQARVLGWLLARYRQDGAASASDRRSALLALAACPDPAAASSLLAKALDPTIIRAQDLATVM